ncbi:MAG: ABC transporter permease subunit [Gaiellales bacterium]
MLSVSQRSIAERKRGLIGWSVGLFALVAFTLAFWPSIKGNSEFDKLFEDLPESLRAFVGENSITSPVGYLESQLFLYLVPVLFAIMTIGRLSDGLAGEERRKTMDLLLANPITRARVVLEKFAASVVSLFVPGAVLFVTLWLGAIAVDLDIGVSGLLAATVGSMLLALVFGALALAIGAATGRKGLAIAVAASAMTAAYLVNSLAPTVESLEPFQKLSPFYYFLSSSPLATGLKPSHTLVLLGITAVLVAVSTWLFKRRDIAM